MKPIFLLAIGALLLCHGAPLHAQGGGSSPVALPRVFLGAGVGHAASDPASRMRLFDDGAGLIWFIDAGAALTPRIGLGVEFAQPAAVAGTSIGRGFRASGRQEERVFIGLLRVRVSAVDRVALDVVGGAGLLFQHHELGSTLCSLECADSMREVLNRRAPAFAFGADVPMYVGRRFWITAVGRYYALRRGNNLAEPTDSIAWQYESKSSTQFAVGIGGRIGW
jgi:hypothetical protein